MVWFLFIRVLCYERPLELIYFASCSLVQLVYSCLLPTFEQL